MPSSLVDPVAEFAYIHAGSAAYVFSPVERGYVVLGIIGRSGAAVGIFFARFRGQVVGIE